MSSSLALPEYIYNEIKTRLLSKEKILNFLSPSESVLRSERANVWIILTNYSIVFCIYEKGTDSLVDTLELKNLREIEYIQRKHNINIEFIPFKRAGNPLKLTFPLKRQADIDNFCEFLADYVTFRKETENGLETFVESIFKEKEQTDNQSNEADNQSNETDKTESIQQNQEKATSPMPKMSIEERKSQVAQQNLLLKEILTNSLKKNRETKVSVLPQIKDLKDSDYTSLPHAVTSLGKGRNNFPAAISGDKIDVKTVGTTQFENKQVNVNASISPKVKEQELPQKPQLPLTPLINGVPTLRKSAVKNKDRKTVPEANEDFESVKPLPVLYYDPAASKPGQIPKYNEEEPEILPEFRKFGNVDKVPETKNATTPSIKTDSNIPPVETNKDSKPSLNQTDYDFSSTPSVIEKKEIELKISTLKETTQKISSDSQALVKTIDNVSNSQEKTQKASSDSQALVKTIDNVSNSQEKTQKPSSDSQALVKTINNDSNSQEKTQKPISVPQTLIKTITKDSNLQETTQKPISVSQTLVKTINIDSNLQEKTQKPSSVPQTLVKTIGNNDTKKIEEKIEPIKELPKEKVIEIAPLAKKDVDDGIKRDENGEIILMESGNAPIPVLLTAVVAAVSGYVWYKLFKFTQKNF